MINHEKLVKQVTKALFWEGDMTDYAKHQPVVSRAIDIARCQLPINLHNETAIFNRAILLFSRGAYYWYENWC